MGFENQQMHVYPREIDDDDHTSSSWNTRIQAHQ
jgi:hypothetical protein